MSVYDAHKSAFDAIQIRREIDKLVARWPADRIVARLHEWAASLEAHPCDEREHFEASRLIAARRMRFHLARLTKEAPHG